MKKIAIMGLCNYENMGDQIIARTVDYLVRQCGEEYDPYYVNFQPDRKGVRYENYKEMRKKVESHNPDEIEHKRIYDIMYWFVSPYYEEMLKNADALIFMGGSFKYRTQNVWATYSIALEYAKKFNIPVMFNAMNIQDYDDYDWRCQLLKEHANFSCVKLITSRDGISGVEKLKNYYIENSDIKLFPAGDPAFWSKECYNYINVEKKDIIGINLIRGDVFLDYGLEVTEEELLIFYEEIIKELTKKGYNWELFTNGMKADFLFGEKVLAKCNMENLNKIYIANSDEDCVKNIAKYKGIIAARLHAGIVAYSLNIPIAGFIWDEKLVHFSEMAKLNKSFCNVNELKGKIIVEKLEEAMLLKYDEENKYLWKRYTFETIRMFLESEI
ncbi:MAG: polysaccharide pyruvyl transferase family protein [Lachnospiraceae bacterium]|nr:polysaccharide pyruvyl transferase family protein [Lachnospiraceae bacterium]